ncbi:hypothetical protein [Rhodoferax mekongensis]|uniref:hypothetical protein n=1 Tax=Rhodoferax mekongensis TaxID=3068341 RepID=UPI0028BE81A3|nr:hypothetical protein [Rhodoferax sp. TBRC 17199]MDT7514557.1 hypothetical protein [Rhodoferax sp. TBRC 17199]
MTNHIMCESDKPTIRDSLSELEQSLDSMRIYCELMNNQLNQHDASSQDGSMRLQERMIVLVRSLVGEIESAVELQAAASIAAINLSAAMEGATQ